MYSGSTYLVRRYRSRKSMKGTQCGQRLTMDRWIVMQDSLNQRDFDEKESNAISPRV